MAKKREMTAEQKKKGQEVGCRIRRLREQMGYSQKELGPKAGFSVHAAAQWETGRVLPRMETLKRIAVVLGTTSEYLWAGDDPDEMAKAHTVKEMEALTAFRAIPADKADAALAILQALKQGNQK